MDIFELFDRLDEKKIREFVDSGQEEDLFLEFKTVNGSGLSHRNDRRNFARALSGFANSSGGIIIWGVEAKKNAQDVDCACALRRIECASMLLSKLNEHTGQFVSPSVDDVKHKAIAAVDDRGFAVTLVPPSDAGPHMAKAGEDRYYKRSGDSFYRMEHFDIEDMFGRRKKPSLSLHTRIILTNVSTDSRGRVYKCAVIVGMENTGRGTAKYPYLTLEVKPPYQVDRFGLDGNRRTGLAPLPRSVGTRKHLFGGNANVVIHPNTILEVTKISIEILEDNTSIDDLVIDAEMSAEDMRTTQQTRVIDGDKLMVVVQPELSTRDDMKAWNASRMDDGG